MQRDLPPISEQVGKLIRNVKRELSTLGEVIPDDKNCRKELIAKGITKFTQEVIRISTGHFNVDTTLLFSQCREVRNYSVVHNQEK